MDFFIILDQSSSIGKENFQKMKNFVNNLLLQSNLGQQGVRVGLITYNRRPQLRFHMNEMENHEQAIAAVDSIVYEGKIIITLSIMVPMRALRILRVAKR